MRPFQLITPFLLAAVDLSLSKSTGLHVHTTVGKVIGTVDDITPDVKQWLGIPFAEPPLGSLRFLPPVKKTSSDVLLAQNHPASCQQYLKGIPNIFDLVPEFDPPRPYSEDCLYLNVIAPKLPKYKDLPVAVWFHGGESTYGGINTPYEKPQKWVQRSQEHIVVQINYRLNLLGFPNAPGLNQSELNPGLLDMRLGIEWVRDNIANFGGDPSKILLWGHSTGAGLVDAYQYAHYKDPIARAIIQESAVVYMGNFQADTNQTTWAWVAEQFNCTGDAKQVLECMRHVDAAALEKLLQAHTDSGDAPSLSLAAAADNATAFGKAAYKEMAAAKNIPKLPTLMGSNSNEGANFVTFSVNGNATTEAAMHQATLSRIQCYFAQESAARVEGGGKTWRYYNAANFTNISPEPWMGAYHFSELPLITGTHADYRGNSTPFEYALSETMQDLWLAFMKDPEHALTAAGWPEYTGKNGTIIVFGEEEHLVQLRSAAVIDAGLAALNCTV